MSRTKKIRMYRQGGVGLFPVASIPAGAVAKAPGQVTLALGEITGHAHRFDVGAAVMDYEITAPMAEVSRFIEVLEKSALRHEEHADIELPAGKYRVVIQREYEPEGWRNVAD